MNNGNNFLPYIRRVLQEMPPKFDPPTEGWLRHSGLDTGKILPRKYTGLSAKHQRAVTRTLKQSRNMLLAQ